MSVFKRGGVGKYYIQFVFNGKTYIRSSKTTNKRAAERLEKQWKNQVHAMVELGDKERITIQDALAGYVAQKQNTGSSKYAKQNADLLNQKFDTDMFVDEIQDWHLTRFKSERERDGIAAQTIKHNFQAIRGAWQWAKDHGYKVSDLVVPKVKVDNKRLRYLTLEEERRLLEALNPMADIPFRPKYEDRPNEENRKRHDNYDLEVVLLDTGARYGEIANITWDRIDMENRAINLWRRKVKNESVIYMTNRVYQILERRLAETNSKYVFMNSKGGPRGHATAGIKNALVKSGLADVTIHDLRHTCASRLIQNGMSLYEVSNILGHVDVQTTQRYAHLENIDVGQKARDIMEQMRG
jgi:integrase